MPRRYDLELFLKRELFNLVADIGETNDLADQQPELLADLVEAWERFAADAGVAY